MSCVVLAYTCIKRQGCPNSFRSMLHVFSDWGTFWLPLMVSLISFLWPQKAYLLVSFSAFTYSLYILLPILIWLRNGVVCWSLELAWSYGILLFLSVGLFSINGSFAWHSLALLGTSWLERFLPTPSSWKGRASGRAGKIKLYWLQLSQFLLFSFAFLIMQEHFMPWIFWGMGMILAAVMLISWKIYYSKKKGICKKKTETFASVF